MADGGTVQTFMVTTVLFPTDEGRIEAAEVHEALTKTFDSLYGLRVREVEESFEEEEEE